MPRGRPRGSYAKKYKAKAKMSTKQFRAVSKKIPSLKAGKLTLVRKLPMIQMACTPGTAGSLIVTDPTATCIQYGTPVLVPNTQACYNIPFSFVFRFSQLQNSSELQVLFDRYRILSVLVKAHWNIVNNNEVKTLPWIEYIQDHDDGTVPSVTAFRERMGIKTKYFSTSKTVIKMGVQPRYADIVYSNGVLNGYGVGNRKEYINMSNPDVEHYAIKGVIHNFPLSGNGTGGDLLDFDISALVALRDIQ